MPYNLQGPDTDIFKGHLLQPANEGAIPALAGDPAWISIYLITCLVLLVLVKARSHNYLLRVFQSTFSSQLLQQLEREEINLFRVQAIALNALFLLNFAFLLYKLNLRQDYILSENSGLTQFGFLLAAILSVLVFKSLFNRVLAACTGTKKLINEYTVSSTLVNQTIGIALFPCLIVLHFSNLIPVLFINIALGLLLIGILLKWYRGLIMAMGAERLGILQIFSYFCALEILPVLVLVKFALETY